MKKEEEGLWVIPTLSCAFIFSFIFCFSAILGINPFSWFSLGCWFIGGCALGFVISWFC